MFVVSDNADEVGVEAVNNDGNKDGPEEVLFLWKLVVSGLFSSGNNVSIFVPGVEVDDIPDSNEGVWNDNKDVSSSNVSSGATVVRVEELHKEAGSNNCWYKEEYGNKYEPPVDVIVKDEVENLNEGWKNKEEGKDSGGNNTALNWETSEAWEILSSIIGAIADAAAANFWLVDGSMSLLRTSLWLLLAGSFISGWHEWCIFFHSGFHAHHVFWFFSVGTHFWIFLSLINKYYYSNYIKIII